MKLSNQINKIVGKNWLNYHPYENPTSIDSYYVALCNNVLKIIQQSDIIDYIATMKEGKELACILVSYFEDIISETHLFSSFTRQHKKMYGKVLPFYEIPDDYYDDEINLQDIYFLIWYNISFNDEEIVYDPYFDGNPSVNEAVLEIYNLFNSEFEKAPQNEDLQDFLQLSADSDVMTIREKLTFIAYNSFLWESYYHNFLGEIFDKYTEGNTLVMDEKIEMLIYDQQIHFIFNCCMPLLSMRANEYYAEVLGEEHPEYQFIKNIPKRIFGCFLLRKIEDNGFLIEHLTSKKQLFLSNEYTTLETFKLIENESVISLGLVQWRDGVWRNQGGCLVNRIKDMEGDDISEHLFDDENKKKELIYNSEKAFMEITKGERIVYFREEHEYVDFHIKVLKEYARKLKPEMSDEKLDESLKTFADNNIRLPFDEGKAFGLFYNSNSGMEIYNEDLIICMPDKNNPYYENKKFDLCDLVTDNSLSTEFINYIIENKLINLCVNDFDNPDMFAILMENLDFLLRFYRRSLYFSKLGVTTNNSNQ